MLGGGTWNGVTMRNLCWQRATFFLNRKSYHLPNLHVPSTQDPNLVPVVWFLA